VALVVLATGAWAQGAIQASPRAAAMGGAGIGVADDAAAAFQNPAGLASLNVPCKDGAEFGNDLLLAAMDRGNTEGWGLGWSGWKPSDSLGFGAFYGHGEGMGSALGASFGAGLKTTPLSAGASVVVVNPSGSSQTRLNLGLLYRVPMGEGKAPLSLGLTINDVTSESANNPIWNAGLGWKPADNLLVALDVTDLSEEIGSVKFGGGAELAFGGEKKEWRGRVGAFDDGNDTHFTCGIGYASKDWRADVTYVDTNVNGTWEIGVGVNL